MSHTHLKREFAPMSWPINRKGTTFVVRPNSELESGIPILVALRDMLKVARTRAEVKKALVAKNVLINERPVKEEKNSVVLFDIITLVPSKKSFVLTMNDAGRYEFEETKESGKKIAKVSDKKILRGKKTQLNLSDGRNYVSEIKCNTNDSVVIDLKTKKVEKCLSLKENAKVLVFAGKHSGDKGNINKIDRDKGMVEIKVKENDVNVLIKQIIVIG
jgi:small subunit ribosomal protein S4e